MIKSCEEDGDEYNWEMKIKNTVHEFLGIEVTELPGGEFKFTQKGLIEKVLKATDCLNVNPKPTPTRVERPCNGLREK